MVTSVTEQRRELGDFVRSQRERLKPAMLGLSTEGRRRTPGLRREEAAQLAGLSVTWYTWLEQGREMSLSPAALARLARALRLDRAARAYLFKLAGKRDPEQDRSGSGRLPDSVLASIASIDAPAYILDREWTVVSWNRKAADLFAGWLDQPGARNLLRFIFTDPAARLLICDYEQRARRVVAEFRSSCSAHLDDQSLKAFIAELRRASPLFAQFWDQRDVVEREGGERTFNHPLDGFRRYEQVTFDVAGHPDFKLTLLVAA
ncbi:MAG: helix-turn-helix transcriptional regulator [Rhizobiaceae bacterium]